MSLSNAVRQLEESNAAMKRAAYGNCVLVLDSGFERPFHLTLQRSYAMGPLGEENVWPYDWRIQEYLKPDYSMRSAPYAEPFNITVRELVFHDTRSHDAFGRRIYKQVR